MSQVKQICNDCRDFVTITKILLRCIKLQGFTCKWKLCPVLCPPDVKNWLIGKDADAGKLKAGDGWMASLDSVDMNLSKLQEIVSEKEAWHAAEHGSQSHTQWRNYIKVSNWMFSEPVSHRICLCGAKGGGAEMTNLKWKAIPEIHLSKSFLNIR